MGEKVWDLIDDEHDERIPESLEPDRAYQFMNVFNGWIAHGLSEMEALRRARESVKTPQDRLELIGEA
ncbi:MAG: hypothetical protein GTN64_05770 [Candidatus Latescibacteria bacterium]|nr:hypothetical protein [Candidatus Latescibacterota bacterium]NIO78115.1 hypothetical protein [Candidatus Latescibacterota bacterium]